MSFDDFIAWVEAHPLQAALIGGGGLIAILYLLGYFSSGSSGSGGQGLAGAYYAAEANQAAVGGQIQVATIQATRDTAIASLQANAAEAIANTQATAATTINAQNAGVSTTLGYDQLLTAQSNNAAAQATAASHDAASTAIATAGYHASEMNTFLSKIVPLEIAKTGGRPFQFSGVGTSTLTLGTVGRRGLTPKRAKAEGYSSSQFSALTGLPGYG